jgi:Secretion system C-terminal sorting domain
MDFEAFVCILVTQSQSNHRASKPLIFSTTSNSNTMKTTISLLATWLCMAYSLLAQPVYDACATPPQPGEIWMAQTTVVDGSGVMPGASGANVVWDFSNWVALNNYTGIDTFYTASSQPQAAAFPASNMASKQGNKTRFLSYTPTEIQNCGIYYANYNQSDYYTDLYKVAECPMQYLDEYDDPYTYVSDTIHILNGHKYSTYDGYGTLILPGRTYQNAIRVHNLDTVANFGVLETYDTYLWIEPTNFRTVCRILTNRILGEPDSNVFVSHSAHTYLGMLPTANAQPLPQVQIFPNPTSGQLRIEGEGFEKGLVTVTSLTGQIVKHLAIHSMEVDLSELPSGMYLYSVQDVLGEVVKTGKLVKQ